MKTDTHTIPFKGRQILAVLDHATALDICAANGYELEIPDGCNTVWRHIRTRAGNAALAYRQTGFTPIQSDNEHEVNGAGCIIIQDSADLTDSQAAEILDAFRAEVMEQ